MKMFFFRWSEGMHRLWKCHCSIVTMCPDSENVAPAKYFYLCVTHVFFFFIFNISFLSHSFTHCRFFNSYFGMHALSCVFAYILVYRILTLAFRCDLCRCECMFFFLSFGSLNCNYALRIPVRGDLSDNSCFSCYFCTNLICDFVWGKKMFTEFCPSVHVNVVQR